MSELLRRLRHDGTQIAACLLVAAVATVLVATGVVSPFYAPIVGFAAVYGILVLAVSLLAGWAGIPSFAHVALLAVGAYTAAWAGSHDWPLEIAVIVAAGISAVVGGAVGFIGSRFSELYAALLTITLALIALEIINAWPAVTGGDEGVPVVSLRSAIIPFTFFAADPATVYLSIAALAACLVVAVLARRTSLRMRISAAKSHPLAARSIGIAPHWQMTLAFAVSGAFAGGAGVLYGLVSGFVSGESFSLDFAVLILAAAVLGGFGSIGGAVVGGAFVALTATLANNLGISQQLVEGLVLIVVLLFFPAGLFPSVDRQLRRRIKHGSLREDRT